MAHLFVLGLWGQHASDRSFPVHSAGEARKRDTQEEGWALRSTKGKVLLNLPTVGREIAVVEASEVSKDEPKAVARRAVFSRRAGGTSATGLPRVTLACD